MPMTLYGTKGGASATTNGYAYLPNGILLQWGVSSTITGSTDQTATVTFPIAFPTSVFNITVGGIVNASGDARLDAQVSVTSLTTTGCSLGLRNSVNGTAVGGNISWIAVGN
jgi:hypothetical protein